MNRKHKDSQTIDTCRLRVGCHPSTVSVTSGPPLRVPEPLTLSLHPVPQRKQKGTGQNKDFTKVRHRSWSYSVFFRSTSVIYPSEPPLFEKLIDVPSVHPFLTSNAPHPDLPSRSRSAICGSFGLSFSHSVCCNIGGVDSPSPSLRPEFDQGHLNDRATGVRLRSPRW